MDNKIGSALVARRGSSWLLTSDMWVRIPPNALGVRTKCLMFVLGLKSLQVEYNETWAIEFKQRLTNVLISKFGPSLHVTERY